MDPKQTVKALSALAHEVRLSAFRMLVQAGPDGLTPSFMAEALGIASPPLSFHLKELMHSGLIAARPDGRKIYYSANFTAMSELIAYLTENCCDGESCEVAANVSQLNRPNLEPRKTDMTDLTEKIYNVLFLCTGNSARSILAEVQLNALGHGKFKAYSAGSHPNGTVNPFAIEFLSANDFPTEGLRSKSWDEFATPDAPVMDYVITVCDQAAGEQCPFWPGQPMSAHWGVADPAAVEGTDEQKRRAFRDTAAIMRKRIELLNALPASALDRMSLKARMEEIGKTT